MKKEKFRQTKKLFLLSAVLALFCSIQALHGQQARDPIDINLIIDGSNAYTAVRDDVSAWISGRLNNIMANGDRVTIWSAGNAAKVIYSGVIGGSSEKELINKTIRELAVSGDTADFTGALKEAAGRRAGSGFSYTLLISASTQSLSSAIDSNLLKYSRVEEFSNWRALVVGLNMESNVKRAANSFMGS